MRAHALGEVGGERELAAGIGRDLRVVARWRAMTKASFSRMPSKRSTWPAKTKVSPGAQLLDEIFLDLAEHAAAAARACGLRRARARRGAP